jgi:hypothetical protein
MTTNIGHQIRMNRAFIMAESLILLLAFVEVVTRQGDTSNTVPQPPGQGPVPPCVVVL